MRWSGRRLGWPSPLRSGMGIGGRRRRVWLAVGRLGRRLVLGLGAIWRLLLVDLGGVVGVIVLGRQRGMRRGVRGVLLSVLGVPLLLLRRRLRGVLGLGRRARVGHGSRGPVGGLLRMAVGVGSVWCVVAAPIGAAPASAAVATARRTVRGITAWGARLCGRRSRRRGTVVVRHGSRRSLVCRCRARCSTRAARAACASTRMLGGQVDNVRAAARSRMTCWQQKPGGTGWESGKSAEGEDRSPVATAADRRRRHLNPRPSVAVGRKTKGKIARRESVKYDASELRWESCGGRGGGGFKGCRWGGERWKLGGSFGKRKEEASGARHHFETLQGVICTVRTLQAVAAAWHWQLFWWRQGCACGRTKPLWGCEVTVSRGGPDFIVGSVRTRMFFEVRPAVRCRNRACSVEFYTFYL